MGLVHRASLDAAVHCGNPHSAHNKIWLCSAGKICSSWLSKTRVGSVQLVLATHQVPHNMNGNTLAYTPKVQRTGAAERLVVDNTYDLQQAWQAPHVNPAMKYEQVQRHSSRCVQGQPPVDVVNGHLLPFHHQRLQPQEAFAEQLNVGSW